jgi:WD40 repeat protein
MQQKKIVRPIIGLLTLSVLLGACAGGPAQTALPATPTSEPPAATQAPTNTPRPLSAEEFLARQDPVTWVGWLADGKTLAVSALSGVHVFDVQAGLAIRTLESSGLYFPVALEPHGGRLLAGKRAWDAFTGQPLYQLSVENISSLAFSPDGKTLAIGEHNSITLWDASTGTFQKTIGVDLGDPRFGLAFTSDSTRLYAVYDNGKVRRAELTSGQFVELFNLPERGSWSTFSPDAQQVLINRSDHGAGNRELWDVQRGEMLIDSGRCDSDVSFTAFSANGNYFAIGPCGLDAQLWDIRAGKMIHAFPSALSMNDVHPEWRSAAFSPGGTRLALGNDLGEIMIWDLESYQPVKTLTIPRPWR